MTPTMARKRHHCRFCGWWASPDITVLDHPHCPLCGNTLTWEIDYMSEITEQPAAEPPAAEQPAELTEEKLTEQEARKFLVDQADLKPEEPVRTPERGLTGTIILDERTIHTACREHIEAIWNVDVELVEIRRRKGKGLEVIATVTPMRENR